MDKEKAKELAKILLAYSEGKRIEVSNNNNSWIATSIMELITSSKYVRIKPAPKLVPFTFKDKDLFKDKWFKYKEKGWIAKPICIFETHIEFSEFSFDYKSILKVLEFEDGSPCGKYVNE